MRMLLVSPLKQELYFNLMPDIGFGYLATALKQAGHRVEVLDLQLMSYRRRIGFDAAIALLLKSDADVIGFKVFNLDIPFVRRASRILKAHRPTIPLIAGGPTVSGFGADIFTYLPDLDYAIAGEAELGLPALLDNLEPGCDLSTIPGLIYRENGDIRQNAMALVEDLDSLGPVDWEIIKPDSYPDDWCGSETRFPVITSRGCPNSCNYCQSWRIHGRKVRTRSLDSVMDELTYLRRRWGADKFAIEDDHFTVNRKRSMEFAQRLIDLDLKFKWHCHSALRVETLDAEMMRLFEKAGCYYARVAIESGSQRVLDLMNRRNKIDEMKRIVESIAENTQIRMMAFFILGYPGETVQDIRMSIAAACAMPLDRVAFMSLMPLPGTTVYDQMVASGQIQNYDLEKTSIVAYTPWRIQRLKLEAMLRFYLRPRIIRSLLSDVESFEQLLRLAKRSLGVLISR